MDPGVLPNVSTRPLKSCLPVGGFMLFRAPSKRLLPVLVPMSVTVAAAQAGNPLDSRPWPILSHNKQRTNRSNRHGPATLGNPILLYDAGSPVNLQNVSVTSDWKTLFTSCRRPIQLSRRGPIGPQIRCSTCCQPSAGWHCRSVSRRRKGTLNGGDVNS
jgi:hypothetical protein